MFTINVLDEVLTYQVEQIIIILPDELDELRIIPKKDYVTLLTCTPYGINSHRLLIRSKRIKTDAKLDLTKVRTDASKVDPIIGVPFVMAVLLVFLFGYWWLCGILGNNRKNTYWYIPYKRVQSWDDRKKE